MSSHSNTWAVVLAAGEGTRLRSLTTDESGRSVPKQYCSLFGESTLLHDALRRAHALVGRDRLCAIVAAQHAEWSTGALWALPRANVITQPRNRGTANGVLLSLLSIIARDPLARVLFLPADHFVADEARLATAMRASLGDVMTDPRELSLVGIEPDEPDPELGYIVPRHDGGRRARVARFVEKPPRDLAERLLGEGALWNSFIFAAAGATLLGLFRDRWPEIVDSMETALARDAAGRVGQDALGSLYEDLAEIDFSRGLLADAVPRLRVVATEACGWSDLGTPRRVGDAVRRVGTGAAPICAARPRRGAPASLAAAYLRPQLAV